MSLGEGKKRLIHLPLDIKMKLRFSLVSLAALIVRFIFGTIDFIRSRNTNTAKRNIQAVSLEKVGEGGRERGSTAITSRK